MPGARAGTRAAAVALLVLCARPTAAGEPAARVVEQTGRWESGYGVEFYNVVGRVKNVSARPLAYVKLRVDAVDASGKTVASADAFNESAEGLSAEGLPSDLEARVAAAKVKPLAAGAEERFRASFLRDETPAFTDARVTVVEAPAAP